MKTNKTVKIDIHKTEKEFKKSIDDEVEKFLSIEVADMLTITLFDSRESELPMNDRGSQ